MRGDPRDEPDRAHQRHVRHHGVDVARSRLSEVEAAVSTAIVGPMTTEELHANLGALFVRLDDGVAERLDEIWPGPGEAPQAYAW